MQLPFGSWTETFRKLGYKRVKRKGHLSRKRIKGRRALCEQLEPRQLLAADLSITQFTAEGTDITVDYEITGQAVPAFDIDLTRSADGTVDDAVLQSIRIDDPADLALGSHSVTISPDFSDVQSDYWLLGRIDAGGEVTETDETNNSATFSGVFQTTTGDVHVHGTSGDDDVSITQPALVKVRLNGVEYTYNASTVTEIHTRTHEGVDDIMGGSGVAKPMWSFGGAGDDDLFGGKKDDYLDGGDGDDYIKGRQGDDELEGRDGDDEIHADAGDDVLRGGDGNDELRGNENDDLLYGGAGADSLYGGQGIDVIYGEDGDDYIEGNEKADTLYGGTGNDTIKGGYGGDTIYGEDGDDTIEGNQDADTIYAGAGNDTVDAGYGNDLVYGGSGDDFIEGKQGGDTIFGEDGDDIITGDSGTNTLDGGKGIDTIDGVTDTNTAPTGDVANLAADEDTLPLVIDLADAFEDAEHLDSELTFTVVGNGNPTLVTSAIASGTDLIVTVAADASGTADLTVRAEDPLNLYSEDTFTLTINAVNDAPIVIGPTPVNVNADEDDNPPTEVDLYAIFDDVDNADTELSFQIISNDNAALFTSVVIAGGALVLTHANNKHGQANIVLRATDPGGLSADVTLAVVVNPINDVPTTSGIADVNVDEDAADTVIDLFAAFADVEDLDTDLVYSIENNTNAALFTATTLDGTAGTLTLGYTPDANGSADITIRATDLGGAYVDETFAVNVAAVNDTPTTVGLADVTVAQGTGSTSVDLAAAFDDIEDGGSLTYSIVGNTDPSLFVSLDADDATRTLTLYYDVNAAGASDVTIRATDGGSLFVDTTFTVTVNAPPQAVGIGNLSVDEDAAPTAIDLSEYFTDVEDGSAGLTYEVVSNSNPGVVVESIEGSELTLGYERDAFGVATLVVRATDSGGLYTDNTVLVEVKSVNDAPTIDMLLDGPDPAIVGADLTLTVDTLIDDSASTTVDFYRDADGNGILDTAVDQHLGSDSDAAGGWSLTVATTGFGEGAQTYYALATDAEGLQSGVAQTTGSVGIVGILDNADPGYTETGSGWTDATSSESFNGAHREAPAGTGANTAKWQFTGLLEDAPHRVFVTWAADATNATNAQYTVSDGGGAIGTFSVDQTVAPASLFDGGQWWHELTSLEVDGGTITVELTDDADGTVIADAVRVLDPFPTIEYLAGDRASVVQGTELLLTAYEVVDTDGSVQKVTFYRDGVEIGTDTDDDDGWSLLVDTSSLTANTYAFTAIATDNANNDSDETEPFTATVVAEAAISGLVGRWQLHDGSGTVATDSVGGNDGTLNNSPVWTDGFAGGALQFDGVDDYVSVPQSIDLTTSGYTAGVWFKTDATGSRDLLALTNASGNHGVLLEQTSDGRLRYLHRPVFGNSGGTNVFSTETYNDGAWHHAAIVKDATHMRLYVDGQEVGSAAVTADLAETTVLTIGRLSHSISARYFKGELDDVQIYDRGLTAEEVTRSKGRLVGHWRFNEDSGATAVDSVGTNDATLHNDPLWTDSPLGQAQGLDGFADGGLDFDGVNDYVSFGDSINLTGGYTASVWFKTDASGTRDLLSLTDASTGNHGVLLELRPDGTLRYLHRSPSGISGGTSIYSPQAVNDGAWHQATIVKDSTHMRLYVDGQQVSSAAVTTPLENPVDLIVGRLTPGQEGAPRFFKGQLDEVRVYDRGLDATEVANLVDVPDNDVPVIEDSNPVFAVPEGAADGAVIGAILATDPNGDDLSYEFIDGNSGGEFAIDANGNVTVPDVSALDFALHPEYELTVRVSDGHLLEPAIPELYATVDVTVREGDLSDGLIANWQLDDTSGTTAVDSAGTNDATLHNGPVWTSGLSNGGLQFDGANDYVSFPESIDLVGSDYSIGIWFKTSATGTRDLLALTDTATNNHGVLLEQRSNGTLRFLHRSPSGISGGTNIFSTESYNDGAWHQATLVKDATHIRLYVDGEDVASAAITTSLAGPVKLTLGRLGATLSHRYFQGTLDEVRIYDRAITATEATMLVDEDNAPPIVEDQVMAVATDAPVATVVGTVHAEDSNPGNTLSYAILSGNTGDAFEIDANTGVITVKTTPLADFPYDLTVEVTDGIDPVTATITIAGADLAQNLLGHWKLDDATGSVATDAAGTNNGTLQNAPAWTDGIDEGALEFDGANDYVSFGSPYDLTGDEYSVAVWFKATASGTRDLVALTDTTTGNHGVLLEQRSDGTLRYLHRSPSGNTGGTNVYSTQAYNDGVWHHAAIVKDATHIRLYVDGMEAGAAAASVNLAETTDLVLGRLGENFSARYFQGSLDDVRIYDRGLSATDVTVLANQSPGVTALAAPTAVIAGTQFDLTATVHDPLGSIQDVAFYRDTNGNGALDVGTDALLGTDTDGTDGWAHAFDSAGLTADTYTLFALATTTTGATSEISIDVELTDDHVILDDGDPGFTQYGTGWTAGTFNASSALDDDYQAAYFPQGTNIAVWNATDLPAGTFDVYVSYVDAANHISAASYRVYTDSPDGNGNLANHTKVGEKFVDQTTPVAADLVDGTQNWERIGRATVAAGGQLSVELDAGGSIGRWAVADGVRLQRIDEVQGVVHDFALHNGAAGATPRAIDLNAAFANVVGLTGDLTFSITGNSNPAVLESAVIDNANGFLTVVASETLGSTTLTISVDDDDADTDADASATFTITVNDNLVQNGSFEQIVTPNPWNYIHAIPEWTLESGPNFELQKESPANLRRWFAIPRTRRPPAARLDHHQPDCQHSGWRDV